MANVENVDPHEGSDDANGTTPEVETPNQLPLKQAWKAPRLRKSDVTQITGAAANTVNDGGGGLLS